MSHPKIFNLLHMQLFIMYKTANYDKCINPYSTETCSNIVATFQCCILQYNVAETLRRLLFAI